MDSEPQREEKEVTRYKGLSLVHSGKRPLGSQPTGKLEVASRHIGHEKPTAQMLFDAGRLFFGAHVMFVAHPLWQPIVQLSLSPYGVPLAQYCTAMRTDEIYIVQIATGQVLMKIFGLCDCGSARNR